MFTWEYSFLFAFLPIFLGIWYFFDKKKLWKSAPNSILEKYTIYPSEYKKIWLMRFFAIFFLIAIFCNIQFSINFQKKMPESHANIIVLDISRSMLAEDIAPNRITAAKNAIKNFIQSRENDTFTLIVFAGKAFTTISNTADKEGIMSFIDIISPNYILQDKPWLSGTNIGDALLLATEEAKKIEGKTSIILLTDGSANIGSNPEESAIIAKNSNNKIYALWIGMKNNIPLSYTDANGQKNFFYDANGEKILTDLDEKLLQKIATVTNGEYFTAENVEKMILAFQNTNANIGNNFYEKTIIQKFALTPLMLIFFIFFLVLENFYKKKMYSKYSLVR